MKNYRSYILKIISFSLMVVFFVIMQTNKTTAALSYPSNSYPAVLPSNPSDPSEVAQSFQNYDNNISTSCNASNPKDPAFQTWISPAGHPSIDASRQPYQLSSLNYDLNQALMWCHYSYNSPSETLYNYNNPPSFQQPQINALPTNPDLPNGAPVNALLNNNDLNQVITKIVSTGKVTFTPISGHGVFYGSVSGLDNQSLTLSNNNQRYWNTSLPFSLTLVGVMTNGAAYIASFNIETRSINEWHGSYYCYQGSQQININISNTTEVNSCNPTSTTLNILITAPSTWTLSPTSKIVGSVGAGCTNTVVAPGCKVTFEHDVKNSGPNDMTQSFKTTAAWTSNSAGQPSIGGQPATNPALANGAVAAVNTNSFTVPSSAKNGDRYCQDVTVTPSSSTSTTSSVSSTPVCVTVQSKAVTIQGLVSDNNGGMSGVTVDLYDCSNGSTLTTPIATKTTSTSNTYNYSFSLTPGSYYCIAVNNNNMPSKYKNDIGPTLNPTIHTTTGKIYYLNPFKGTPTTGYYFHYVVKGGLSVKITAAKCTNYTKHIGVVYYSVSYPSNYVTVRISPNGSPNPQYKPFPGTIGPAGTSSGRFTVSASSAKSFVVQVDYKGTIKKSSPANLNCSKAGSNPPGGNGAPITGTCNLVTSDFATSLQPPYPPVTVTFTYYFNGSSSPNGTISVTPQDAPPGSPQPTTPNTGIVMPDTSSEQDILTSTASPTTSATATWNNPNPSAPALSQSYYQAKSNAPNNGYKYTVVTGPQLSYTSVTLSKSVKYTVTVKGKKVTKTKTIHETGQNVTATYTVKYYQEEFTRWIYYVDPPIQEQFSTSTMQVTDSYGGYGVGLPNCDSNAPTLNLVPMCSNTDVVTGANDTDHALPDNSVSYGVSTTGGTPNFNGTYLNPPTNPVDMSTYDQLVSHNVSVELRDINVLGNIAPAGMGWDPTTASTIYGPCYAPTCNPASPTYGPNGNNNIYIDGQQAATVSEYHKSLQVEVKVGYVGLSSGSNGQNLSANDYVTGSPNPPGATQYTSPPQPAINDSPTPTLTVTVTPSDGSPPQTQTVFGQQAADGTVLFKNLQPDNYTVSWQFTSPAMSNQGLSPYTIGTGMGGCAPEQFVVAYEPYFRVYGGDISGGNGIDLSNTGTCSPNTASNSVIGWNEDNYVGYAGTAYNYAGAGSQYAAYAITHIAGFATGDGSYGGPPGGSPTLLSFANSSVSPGTDNFGGNYAGNLPCIPNYYRAPIAKGTIQYTCPGSITINNGQIPYSCSATVSQGSVSVSSGSVSATAYTAHPTYNLNSITGRVVVKVKGNVHLSGGSGPTFNNNTMWGALQSGTGAQDYAPVVNQRHTRQYSTCGNNQVYHVAPNATSVNITAIGGQGGGGGAYGSQVTNTISVPPGTTTLSVDIGCPGNGTNGGSGYLSGNNGISSPGYYAQGPYVPGYSYNIPNGQMMCMQWTYYPPAPPYNDAGMGPPCLSWVEGWNTVTVPGYYAQGPYVPGVSGNGGGGSSAVLLGNTLMIESAGGAGSGTYAGAGGGSNYSSVASPSIDPQASTPGSVNITSNVPFNISNTTSQVPPPNTTSVSLNIPSLYIIAKGNIYIDPSISQMSGVYVAEGLTDNGQGVIYTCNEPINQSYYSNCNSNAPLVVNGAFVAGRVAMGRTYGTADTGAPGDTAGNPSSGWNNAAEVFNYTPAVWLNNPFASTSNTYDSISNLPPVL